MDFKREFSFFGALSSQIDTKGLNLIPGLNQAGPGVKSLRILQISPNFGEFPGWSLFGVAFFFFWIPSHSLREWLCLKPGAKAKPSLAKPGKGCRAGEEAPGVLLPSIALLIFNWESQILKTQGKNADLEGTRGQAPRKTAKEEKWENLRIGSFEREK